MHMAFGQTGNQEVSACPLCETVCLFDCLLSACAGGASLRHFEANVVLIVCTSHTCDFRWSIRCSSTTRSVEGSNHGVSPRLCTSRTLYVHPATPGRPPS
jgi:hypothetical protein